MSVRSVSASGIRRDSGRVPAIMLIILFFGINSLLLMPRNPSDGEEEFLNDLSIDNVPSRSTGIDKEPVSKTGSVDKAQSAASNALPPFREPPDQSTLDYPKDDSTKRPLSEMPIHKKLGDPKDDSNISAAVCHKTLFGDIDLFMVYEWIVYHRMLGFDHFFISYIEPVRELPDFDLIDALPYVTFYENSGAHVIHVEMEDRGNPGYMKNYTRLGGPNNQRVMEAQCTDYDAAAYDWVYLADADEYLYWNENIGVKEFLSKYHDDYDYLSFGKQMYTYFHKVLDSHPDFKLADYPFTGGNYCLHRDMETGKAIEYCPKDRAKLIVKPSVHKGGINVHGTHRPETREESIHFLTPEAHVKEWNSANMPDVKALVRERKPFLAHELEEVYIHGFELSYATENGTVEMLYDESLSDWFDFVAGRGEALS